MDYTCNGTCNTRVHMQKKLTITVDEAVYEGLYKIVGARKISQFIEDLARRLLKLGILNLAYELIDINGLHAVVPLAAAEAPEQIIQPMVWRLPPSCDIAIDVNFDVLVVILLVFFPLVLSIRALVIC